MENHRDEEFFSKSVRAGKRTYFFDVKEDKKGELYLKMTESRRNFDDSGEPHYEKHKIFLYKEDFDKFSNGFEEALEYIKKNNNE